MVDSNLIISKNIFLINDIDKFIINKNGKSISIGKQNKEIKEELFDSKYEKLGTPIDGILGIIDAREHTYLLTISQSSIIGTIMRHNIFKIDKINFVSFQQNDKQAQEDVDYLKMITCFFDRNTFYYSITHDLSVSNYSIAKNNGVYKSNDSALFSNSRINYLWNYHNTRQIDHELLQGIIPAIINGYIGIKSINSYDKQEFNYVLISRKEISRSGYRFIVRGIDLNGKVANFAETEQFVVIDKLAEKEFHVYDYLQIRGSIPLIWNQLPNLQLNPPIKLNNNPLDNSRAFNRHFNEMISSYDKVNIVNLIDGKGDQKVIADSYTDYYMKFKQSIQTNNSNNLDSTIDYTWFDFHSECKKMKYQNLNKLLQRNSIASALSNQNYSQIIYLKDSTGKSAYNNIKIQLKQQGVFRTNCIDNLDRTNVVQGVFARQFLHKILYRLGISEMPHGDPFEEFNPSFESKFREVWGDNGDILSKSYSGTNALKRDFTRTGKRTIKGSIDDGINTSTRFYINNFCDGYNQDCHDFYTGNLNPRKNNFKKHSTVLIKSVFLMIIVLSYTLYTTSISISMDDKKDYGIRGVILKGLIFAGMLSISFIGLLNSFKQSVIDLSTNPYH